MVVERDNLRHRLWFKAVQPVKKIDSHFQSVLFGRFHRIAQVRPSFLHVWIFLELVVLPLERDGVVEEELRSALEFARNCFQGEVPMDWARDIGEHECNVVGQGFGEDGRQSGECIIGADSDSWDGSISEDKDRSNRINVLLDLSCNAPLMELILLKTSGVCQPWCVEDADLGARLCLLNKNTGAYYRAVFARNFVKAGRVGLTLIIRTTLLIRGIEDVEIVVINVADEDIGNELQD